MRRTSIFRTQLVWVAVAVARAIAGSAAFLTVLASVHSCSPASVIPELPENPDDPEIPIPPGVEKTVSVAFLKTLYSGAPTFITGEYRISGAVVSSDDKGNFYKTLVVDDGTGGIEVRMDMEEIFKRFKIFSHVTIRCNGLWLGSYGGTLQLGAEPFEGYETQFLSEVEIVEHILEEDEFYGEVRPSVLTFSELATKHISTFVAFERVRFIEEEHGMAWAETDAEADTNRHITDASGDTLVVRTSRYARFAAWPLPEGTGRIEGVLGCFNGDYQLVVCDSEKFD